MRSALTKLGVMGLIVLVAGAYVALIALYADTVENVAANNLSDSPDVVTQSAATLTVEEMQSNYSAVVANLAISLGSELLDPLTHRLKEDVILRVRSAATPTRREYTKGMLPGVFPVPLTLAGHVERWPFDHYHSGPIQLELFRGANTENPPDLVRLTFIDHLPGFKVVPSNANGHEVYRLDVRRSTSTAVFAVVIVGVLVALAVLALAVAVQTMRDRRPFQPPMTTWYAAMLFAVVPLRNALPGSPPFGAWIDVTVVLWVIVALVSAMLVYLVCWWRHLKPPVVATPSNPPASPSN